MKSLVKFCLAAGLLLVMTFSIGCSDKNPSKPEVTLPDDDKYTWLQENAISLQSLQAENTDYSDLEPLRDILADKRVVMLGEQTHGDGTTFQAKVRLIKFLHQEMGFDVLAFESGFFDCMRGWTDVLGGKSAKTAAEESVFGFYTGTVEVKPLLDYLQTAATSSSPLEFSGFDCQATGSNGYYHLTENLQQYLATVSNSFLESEAWQRLKSVLEGLPFTTEAPADSIQNDFFDTVQQLIGIIEDNGVSHDNMMQDAGFWTQMLKSTIVWAKMSWATTDLLNLRDAQLADNFMWLVQNRFAGRKIIIWAATYHIVHNIDTIEPLASGFSYAGTVNMGQLVRQEMPGDCYTLGFTGYEGTHSSMITGEILNDLPMPVGSLDAIAKSAGLNNAWIDFSQISDDNHWLKRVLKSRPLGNITMSADWTAIMDGMFFSSKMEHCVYTTQ